MTIEEALDPRGSRHNLHLVIGLTAKGSRSCCDRDYRASETGRPISYLVTKFGSPAFHP